MSTSPEIAAKQAGREIRRTVFTEEEIQARVMELAQEVNRLLVLLVPDKRFAQPV